MEYLKALTPVAVAVLGAVLAYLFNQRAERRRRSEQYQLEQIETILKTFADNAETHDLDPSDPVRREILRNTTRAMTLLKIYGDPEVVRINKAHPGRMPAEALDELIAALQRQGRSLARPNKSPAQRPEATG